MENKKFFIYNLKRTIGGINANTLELKDILDNDDYQIVSSNLLFNVFDKNSKSRKNYEEKNIKELLKYVVKLYNEELNTVNKPGALDYIEKVSLSLDYLTISNIIELSFNQIKLILLGDVSSIKDRYLAIKNSRHLLTNNDFKLYEELLKNNDNDTSYNAKKVFAYISEIYNNTVILQDNVDYITFLENMAKINQESIIKMRMYQIIDIFKMYNLDNEAIKDSKESLLNLAV